MLSALGENSEQYRLVLSIRSIVVSYAFLCCYRAYSRLEWSGWVADWVLLTGSMWLLSLSLFGRCMQDYVRLIAMLAMIRVTLYRVDGVAVAVSH